jgi:hypothetical protein
MKLKQIIYSLPKSVSKNVAKETAEHLKVDRQVVYRVFESEKIDVKSGILQFLFEKYRICFSTEKGFYLQSNN